LLRNITPRRHRARSGGDAVRQRFETEELRPGLCLEGPTAFTKVLFKKLLFCASFGHRQSHKERLLK
jgi:hypothetical protein